MEETTTRFCEQSHASLQADDSSDKSALRAVDDVVASITDHSSKKYCIGLWSLHFVRFFVCTRNVN
jgi:hypothetical protein